MGPYINVRYIDSRIIIDFYISKRDGEQYREWGICSERDNLEQVKNKILELTQYTKENTIILKSVLRPKMMLAYKSSKIEMEKLQRLKTQLSQERKNITFLIEEELPIKRKPLRRNSNFHANIIQ